MLIFVNLKTCLCSSNMFYEWKHAVLFNSTQAAL